MKTKRHIKKKFRGYSFHRIAREPLERIFVELWQKQNDVESPGRSNALLDFMLAEDHSKNCFMSRSDEEHKIAATVIQWLGTPVGQGFLRDVMQRARNKGVQIPMLWDYKNE